MSDQLSVSLDLNEEIRLFVRKRLRDFASEHPESKFNVNSWLDDLNIGLVADINEYLAENECPDILKKGGDIIGKSRAQFYRYTKKEVV